MKMILIHSVNTCKQEYQMKLGHFSNTAQAWKSTSMLFLLQSLFAYLLDLGQSHPAEMTAGAVK